MTVQTDAGMFLPHPRKRALSGNNSVVECDLAKVEVAGSNPVSRSRIDPGGRKAAGVFIAGLKG